jgi:hypothetical protein
MLGRFCRFGSAARVLQEDEQGNDQYRSQGDRQSGADQPENGYAAEFGSIPFLSCHGRPRRLSETRG